MTTLHSIKESLLHFIFPHSCEGCGSDIIQKDHLLCIDCLSSLPATNFHMHGGNRIEKVFWGRIPVTYATAQYYFTQSSLIQRLMHQLKYRGNKDLGIYLGKLIGNALIQSNRFLSVDALVPLPLYPVKEKKRGYNQTTLLCKGMAEVMEIPVLESAVVRNYHTESQTKKNRVERWKNMEGRFEIKNEILLEGKHVLLVDDVITTGATLEACGSELLKVNNLKLSIATLCYSTD